MIASLSRSRLATAFAGLCLAWALVHGVYLATLDDGLFLDANGAPILVWFLPNLVVPLGLLVARRGVTRLIGWKPWPMTGERP